MEFFDEDLKEIMGDLYDDGDTPIEMPAMEIKKPVREAGKFAREAIVQDVTTDVPYPNERHGVTDKLRAASTWLGICGGICMLMWWFEVNGLMAMEAAYPCILASAMIGTGGVVWCVKS